MALQAAVILLASGALFAMSSMATVRRSVPDGAAGQIYRVETQRDVYGVYRLAGLRGAHAVHVNRFFNMVDYFPGEETTSRPFPLPSYDIRPYYEKRVTSHNWLFIATRTGLVRRVTTVVPEAVYRNRVAELSSTLLVRPDPRRITGYSYDIPWTVAMLESLPAITGPVVVTVDAGYFASGADPRRTAAVLRERCPDIRLIVLVDSHDEKGITDGMREDLLSFELALRGAE